ncbi:MAG: transcriptional regulator [Puniceicoccaceae bacterium]|nr:transcriptional regulator [Puniceicoccaceae bacterium]
MEEAFAEILRIRRKELGLSQQKLADKTGISANFISSCERSIRQPSLNTIFLLAYGLEISPSDLVKQVEVLKPKPKY